MTVVSCDMPGCPSRFHTGSMASKAQQQAAAVGWLRMSGKKIKTNPPGQPEEILSDKQVDICPSCKPAPRMTA